MGRNLLHIGGSVNFLFQEEAVKEKTPFLLSARNGVYFILATNHLPVRMMESIYWLLLY